MLPEMDPRERESNRLREEMRLASIFATFTQAAHNRGYEAKLTIEVDGVPCETGLLLSAKEPLMEYLANWACAEHYKKAARLMEFEKRDRNGDFNSLDGEGAWKRIQELRWMADSGSTGAGGQEGANNIDAPY